VLPAGAYRLTASFSPTDSTDYLPSTAAATLTVTQASTTVTLTSWASNAFVGASISFTATAIPASGSNPTGTVTFFDGATAISPAIPLVANTAGFSISTLAAGAHSITAQYSGDTNYLGAVSAALSITIVIPPNFTLALGNNALQLDVLLTLPDEITLTPIAGYSGTVHFSCSGLPKNTDCVFIPPALTLANGKSDIGFLTIIAIGDLQNERGDYQVTVTATDGTITHTATLTLAIGE